MAVAAWGSEFEAPWNGISPIPGNVDDMSGQHRAARK